MINSLKKIFKDEAILCIGSQTTHVTIEEKEIGAKLKKIVISELEQNCLVLGLDEARNIKNGTKISKIISPVFGETDECIHNKACDALIFKEKSENELDIFYVDLKSDKPTGFADQFKSSRCFARYIESILQILCNKKIKINKERYTVLHTDSSGKRKSIGKRPTIGKQQQSTPENPKKIIVLDNDTISFNRIR